MQATRQYGILAVLRWQNRIIPIIVAISSLPVILYNLYAWEWLKLPWQPISLIGIAVAFYLGFKNNSSYDRTWEARKIWGGIVNASRSFTVMARDFVNNPAARETLDESALRSVQQSLVYRHVAWMRALTLQLRKPQKWEHFKPRDEAFRKVADTDYDESKFARLKPYLSEEEYHYLMQKGNKASHLLSLQSKHIMGLRNSNALDPFLHQQLQGMITEFYTLMGKAERIKNFPFPRQYAGINFYFTFVFMCLVPMGMLTIFDEVGGGTYNWLAIPFSTVASWVFVTMEMIGDYSENPFEGLYNDVPITNIATGIEIDIRQMLEEADLPEPTKPVGGMSILV